MIPPKIAAVVLAAGSSSRMEGGHKLLEPLDGRPIVTRAVEAAIESGSTPVVVVTGHRREDVEAALPGSVQTVHNPDYQAGLASSLRAGLLALPADADAVFVALGDMPLVRATHYEALVTAWRPDAIAVPTRAGRRGHPVLWPARLFADMCALQGDRGAKSLMTEHATSVIEVPAASDAILLDVDVAGDLERLRGLG